MVVSISGASGFIGQALIRKFRNSGWKIRIIDRDALSLPDEVFRIQKIEGSKVVINLAGAPVSAKWTEAYKKEIMISRVNTTLKISENINACEKKPELFISASAIGIYDTTHTHTEESQDYGYSYLATLCRNWEDAASQINPGTRLVILRLGVVLGENGGILGKLSFPFSIGLGAKIGKGDQAFSFIHMDDLLEAIFFIIGQPMINGIVNAVSPHPTTNAEFTEKLGKVFKQSAFLTIPTFIMKLKFGEGAQTMLEGQKVLPEKLIRAGFRFKYPSVQNALVQLFGSSI